MRLLLAIFLPPVLFLTIGRPLAAIICLVLQITMVGWLPAALWAIYALSNYNTDKKIAAMQGQRGGIGGELDDAKAAVRFGVKQAQRLLGK
ncbi:MAG: YqaE/Pmp3 family membrane protein [Proteobacteria bacterium]|nr:YqaE/Pmp3 family membrane protein [Pseudomonadota bacterium]